MNKLKVLYVHGYGGSENGKSSKIIANALSKNFDVEMLAPAIPYLNPEKALEVIRENAKDCDIVVASSLGAFYTAQVYGKPKFLINPAFPDDIYKISGNMGLSKELEYQLTWLKGVLDMEFRCETYILLGDSDTVCNNREKLENMYWPSHIHTFDCGHELSENTDLSILVSLIKHCA